MIKSICVFCGSTPGVNGAYVQAAYDLGQLLAKKNVSLVFGGGMVGMMGAVADGALAGGGHVIGIIPEAMNLPRVVHEGLSERIVVGTMHERKAKMSEVSDAFIALPGGLGTYDELFETMTWAQLGYQPKPIGLLNVEGYFDPLVVLVDHTVEQGFVRPQHRHVFVVEPDPTDLLAALNHFQHPAGSLHDKIGLSK